MKGWEVLAVAFVLLALALLLLWHQAFVEYFDGPDYWQWRIVIRSTLR